MKQTDIFKDISNDKHEAGVCAMRGTCGRIGWGQELPCPVDSAAEEPDSEFRLLLTSVCGASFAHGPVCCTAPQVEALQSSLQQAENLISSCPACRNNFREFYCSFTCSPNQSTFLNVTSVQETDSGQEAVESVAFHVGKEFGEGFFNSCKDVKFSGTNGYAMDFIGGGAKEYLSFFKYMGDKRPGLGSPFQIDFPTNPTSELTPLSPSSRSCSDTDLGSRCTCVDCPSICPSLPPVSPPNSGPTCHVGSMSCFSFGLVLLYSLVLFSFFVGYIFSSTIRRRRERSYERVALFPGDNTSNVAPSVSSHRLGGAGSATLVGASSLSQYQDAENSSGGAPSDSRQNLGRGASLLDPIEALQPRQYTLNTSLRRFFYKLGLTCARSPWVTFAIASFIIGLMNLGWKWFAVETDPVRLWVAPSSESKIQKDYFDQHFGPFYKTEQIFITSSSDGPVLSWNRLNWWFDVEKDIRDIRSEPNGYSLEDVCFKPAGPSGACVVQSVAGWFNNDIEGQEDSWEEHIMECAAQPSLCLPDFGQPLSPQYVLGGAPKSEEEMKLWQKARALVVTYVISDSLDDVEKERAEEWERALRGYLETLSSNAREKAEAIISFSTGVSLEEELNKSTNTDVKIVVLSYLVMFFYVSLTLGRGGATHDEPGIVRSLITWGTNLPKLFSPPQLDSTTELTSTNRATWFPRLPRRRLFVGTKFVLGLFGILLVIVSVSTSVGFFSLVGVRVTLIIAEVIPFLVLAVGVDNVFLLVHELDRQNNIHGPNAYIPPRPGQFGATPLSPQSSHRSPFTSSHDSEDPEGASSHLAPEERVARALAKMGPSILLSTITETLAFALGALVPMPAVRNFALYAAGSVLLDAILQVTVFVSALAWDLRRVESNRIDCFPCVKLPSRIALAETTPHAGSILARFMKRTYAPFILKSPVKGGVLAFFGGVFVASIVAVQHIQLGLDQRLALPSESYLIPYFDALDAYFDVGPPVYFVSKDVDVSKRADQRHLCARFTTCDEFSITNILEAERKRPSSSFISEPTASWIDDFLHWLDPALETCCRVRKTDTSTFCSSNDAERLCQPCFADREPPWNITMYGLPQDEEFMRYLGQWLASPTDEDCPLGGRASFGNALSFDGATVSASHFRTFHAPLKSQADFINAFEASHRIADDISRRTGTSVFPYSLFYVFFDQYAHIISITQEVLGLGLASVLIATALLLGSWRTGTIITAVVALTVVNVMGVMGAWGINLNAISLVNLVISLGIAVEFCSHIARAFMGAGAGLPVDHPAGQKERDERVFIALVDVGPSVLSGITLTKLIGISVLALTRSRLLEIYYFRMWLTLIISGALHALVLLPVVLSLAGGSGYALEDADEEWMSSAIRRNEYSYTPFLADSDSILSD